MELTTYSPDRYLPDEPNNDYDRTNYDADDQTIYEDSVQIARCPYTPTLPTPDNSYRDASGRRVIPTKRDLEDYARLWVSGVSNTLSRLPTGSTVTLSWGDVGSPNTNNPVIDLFAAADADGGIGYLTNSTIAAKQTNITQCPYIRRLGPGGSIQLNASTFSNNWAGDHFIWCGAAYGSGALTLTIADGSGNTLAQATAYIQIVDIKQMYERWTVGDRPTYPPVNVAALAGEDLPQPFYYTNQAPAGTPYILYVHGWNMERWEKDRWTETAFKRLYWQGYQGRFGSFRWPTGYNFKGWKSVVTDPDNFDNSEFSAWRSGAGLFNLLTNLNTQYPNHVYLMAHSMGNVVAGEALRQAGNNQAANAYVAMQAAVPSHCYDQSAPPRTLGPLGIWDSGTPNRYSNYWTTGASCYFNGSAGAGNYVNFFNTNDFALDKWTIDQNLKPDIGYGYDTSYPDDQNRFSRGLLIATRLYFPTNTYEIFAYCDEARCYALGAQKNVGGVFTTGSQVELDAPPYGFGPQHLYHSYQFRLDNAKAAAFWKRLLIRFALTQDQ